MGHAQANGNRSEGRARPSASPEMALRLTEAERKESRITISNDLQNQE